MIGIRGYFHISLLLVYISSFAIGEDEFTTKHVAKDGTRYSMLIKKKSSGRYELRLEYGEGVICTDIDYALFTKIEKLRKENHDSDSAVAATFKGPTWSSPNSSSLDTSYGSGNQILISSEGDDGTVFSNNSQIVITDDTDEAGDSDKNTDSEDPTDKYQEEIQALKGVVTDLEDKIVELEKNEKFRETAANVKTSQIPLMKAEIVEIKNAINNVQVFIKKGKNDSNLKKIETGLNSLAIIVGALSATIGNMQTGKKLELEKIIENLKNDLASIMERVKKGEDTAKDLEKFVIKMSEVVTGIQKWQADLIIPGAVVGGECLKKNKAKPENSDKTWNLYAMQHYIESDKFKKDYEKNKEEDFEIRPRKKWKDNGAEPRANMAKLKKSSVTGIVLHHTATEYHARPANILKEHMTRVYKNKLWKDVGYHYLVDHKGVIYKGRSLDYKGASVKNNNSKIIAIAVIGNLVEAKDDNTSSSILLGSLDTHEKLMKYPLVGREDKNTGMTPAALKSVMYLIKYLKEKFKNIESIRTHGYGRKAVNQNGSQCAGKIMEKMVEMLNERLGKADMK